MVDVYDREHGRVKAYVDGICVWTEKLLVKIRQGWTGDAFRFHVQTLVARIDACLVKDAPSQDTVPHLRWLLITAANNLSSDDVALWRGLIEQLEHLKKSAEELRAIPEQPVPDHPQEGPEYRADYRQEYATWLSHHEKVEKKIHNQVSSLRALTDAL